MSRLAGLGIVLLLAMTGCTGVVGPEEGWIDGVDAGPSTGQLADAGESVDPSADAAPPQDQPLAAGVSIRDIDVYQTVAVPLVRDGAAITSRSAPVIAGADALFAIHVDVDRGFSPRTIDARVTIDGVEYASQHDVRQSSDDTPATALRVNVPGEAIAQGASFEVSLHELDIAPAQDAVGARYPADGVAELGAVSAGGPLHLVVVPFRYNADGSGRLPPTEAAADAYYEAFKAIFPVADVELTVRNPVDMSMSLATSDGWSDWLGLLRAVREADAPSHNTYYYGIAAPASSFRGYCSGSCIAGLGHVPSAGNSFLFASVGVSFDDALGVGTAVHEVGHTMGRRHAPCGGASGVDSSYPYQGASIGSWGYDFRRGEFKSPSQFTDVMGYCRSQWISDYQYRSVYDRISTVNAMAPAHIGPPQTYRVGTVDADGAIEWERYATLDVPATGGELEVSLLGDAGGEIGVATGHFYPYSHLPGGVVYMPIDDDHSAAAAAPAGILAR